MSRKDLYKNMGYDNLLKKRYTEALEEEMIGLDVSSLQINNMIRLDQFCFMAKVDAEKRRRLIIDTKWNSKEKISSIEHGLRVLLEQNLLMYANLYARDQKEKELRGEEGDQNCRPF